MTDEMKRWIEAAKVLHENPKAAVKCPRCGQANIEVEDVDADDTPGVFERYFRCPKCNAWNVARMVKE